MTTLNDAIAKRKPGAPPRHVVERMIPNLRVDPDTGCWEWTGYKDPEGYGRINVANVPLKAHRVLYQHVRGEIPDGLVLDHLCGNRPCVNPDHLDPVTQGENVRRSVSAQKDRCIHGHEYTPENTHRTPEGRRRCRTCGRDRANRANARKRIQAVGGHGA